MEFQPSREKAKEEFDKLEGAFQTSLKAASDLGKGRPCCRQESSQETDAHIQHGEGNEGIGECGAKGPAFELDNRASESKQTACLSVTWAGCLRRRGSRILFLSQ